MTVDDARLLPLRRLHVGMLIRIPGFAHEFRRRVPPENVNGGVVTCSCGAELSMAVGELEECGPHEDGRVRCFLRTREDAYRVAVWEVDDAAAA
jgi:hypothetical protein